MSEATRTESSGRQSISQHPLFPAFVGLWFGGLFGLGGFAIGAGLIPGLDLSLGLGARIALALAMAAIGGILGVALAPLVTRRRGAVGRLSRDRSALFEELEEAMVQPAPLRGSAALEAAAALPLVDSAPAVGDAPQILDLADGDAVTASAPPPAGEDQPMQREAQADADDARGAESDASPREPADDAIVADKGEDDGRRRASGMTSETDDSLDWLVEAVSEPVADSPSAAVAAEGDSADQMASADLSALSTMDLVERFALALQRRRAARASAARDAALAHTPAADPIPAQSSESATANTRESATAEAPSVSAQARETSPLRLTLADLEAPHIAAPTAGDSAVSTWPAKAASAPEASPTAPAEPEDGEADLAGESAAHVSPRSGAGDHKEGLVVSPRNGFVWPDDAFFETESQEGDVGPSGKPFSSLFKSSAPPQRHAFIQIEDLDVVDDEMEVVAKPVVAFPRPAMSRIAEFPAVSAIANGAPQPLTDNHIAGVISPVAAPAEAFGDAPAERPADAAAQPAENAAQAAGADIAETERALRSALASLRRISGAV